jgi:ankyrin repeat protein
MNTHRLLVCSIAVGLSIMATGACAVSDKTHALFELKRMTAGRYYTAPSQIMLITALGKGDLQAAQKAIDQGADINAIGNDGMTPLFWALGKQNLPGVRFLLKHGANPNQITHWRDQAGLEQAASAPHLAAIMGSADFLRAVLDGGGDPNLVEDQRTNETPIYSAILHQRRANVDLLLQQGADINHRNLSGATPINYAVNTNHYSLAIHLLQSGADPKIQDRWGYSAIDTTKQFGGRGIAIGSSDAAAYTEFIDELKRRGLW